MEKLVPVSELIREDGTLQLCTGVGGYGITFLDVYESPICADCAGKAWEGKHDYLGAEAIKGGFIYCEGAPLQCGECGEDIESEYGDPDEEDNESEAE